ncbi:G patch domain-containing protein 4 [Esox lucius]|uniref:G patch domain-containing protein 4 n=1 Tax=Esox lucius TaxID=8010 RepID=A0A6Q2Y061_ESOLU|nr:G patch domain-containing protein 4 [Esox lucius]XP_010904212.2 G patch domain-containing protein 4 [Esox lucius]
MAEGFQEKSRGLNFAEKQLMRHGWEQGKGLGRQEDGISEAIKVKVKCDKGGVGHHQGEQFTFHWWDHVFNKAASNLEVESGQNGVRVKTLVEDKEEGMISNKKPRKATLGREKLYGSFVKSATLLAGLEQKSSSTDDSSSEDEDRKLDLSSSTKLSDDDLMKACGGRTAHKGARHGLTMSAKLARLEQQEQEFMEKYGKKSQKVSTAPNSTTTMTRPAAQSPEPENELVGKITGKKDKKRKNHSGDLVNVAEENVEPGISEMTDMEVKIKKKKKKGRSEEHAGELTGIPLEEDLMSREQNTAEKTKRKHLKNRKVEEGERCNINGNVHESAGHIACEARGGSEEICGVNLQHSETTTKKKSSKKTEETPVCMENTDTEAIPSETVDAARPKKKKKAERKETVEEQPEIKKKKKKLMEDKQTVEDCGFDNACSIPLKKKHKSKCIK